jgi:hypothetical protein
MLNQGYRNGMAEAVAALPEQVAARVLSSIAFTASPAIATMGERGERLVEQAREAFVSGVGDAVLTASVLLVVAALVVAIVAPRAKDRSQRPPGQQGD